MSTGTRLWDTDGDTVTTVHQRLRKCWKRNLHIGLGSDDNVRMSSYEDMHVCIHLPLSEIAVFEGCCVYVFICTALRVANKCFLGVSEIARIVIHIHAAFVTIQYSYRC